VRKVMEFVWIVNHNPCWHKKKYEPHSRWSRMACGGLLGHSDLQVLAEDASGAGEQHAHGGHERQLLMIARCVAGAHENDGPDSTWLMLRVWRPHELCMGHGSS